LDEARYLQPFAAKARPFRHAFAATTWPQFFLKFLLGHEAITAVIPGTTNPAHLADNISAGHGRFPDAGQRKEMIKFFDTL